MCFLVIVYLACRAVRIIYNGNFGFNGIFEIGGNYIELLHDFTGDELFSAVGTFVTRYILDYYKAIMSDGRGKIDEVIELGTVRFTAA